MAAREGQREVAEQLLKANPKPNLELENANGRRPLELAVLHKKVSSKMRANSKTAKCVSWVQLHENG